jgi:flagellar biosynthesis/type III secretory pathway M-ring protein FliF/YscJ
MEMIKSLKTKWDNLNKKGKMLVGGAAVVVIYLIVINV